MADNSKETVEGVVPQIKAMTDNLETIIKTIQQIADDSEEQTNMVEEFQIAFGQIVSITSNLYEQSKIL